MGNWLARGSLAILWCCLLAFTVAICISWARGLDIACGCFGLDDETVNYPVKLAQNFALLALGGWLWRVAAKKFSSRPKPVVATA